MSRPPSYASLAPRFVAGDASPSAELEARLALINQHEPAMNAFVHVARDAAAAAAAASDRRWRANKPLSPIDGMAIGIKDVIETEDMPTGQGSPLWAGTHTKRDAACVQALREAGAVIVAKTTTTEYAGSEPLMPTRNPHDGERTAGGSSSGSAAAVGAGILPAALGTQVVGSTLRPASYCGCVGFKPTFGTLNRGGIYDYLSQSCLGMLAATPQDAWTVASVIAQRVGGDPGFAPLHGPLMPPPARAPKRLALLQTGGWDKASAGAKAALDGARKKLTSLGVDVVDRSADPDLEALEHAILDVVPLTFRICDYEQLWPRGTYARHEGMAEATRRRLAAAQTMTTDDYREALWRRHEIRQRYAWASARYDAVMTLGATGAAPKGLSWTGDPAFNVPASLLGTPAVSLPLLTDERMPLGLQLIGRTDEDADLMAVAAWVWQAFAP